MYDQGVLKAGCSILLSSETMQDSRFLVEATAREARLLRIACSGITGPAARAIMAAVDG